MPMANANEAHAELGYRTLLVHAQYVNKDMSGGNIEEVAVDLLTSLMHLDQQYGANFDDMLRMAKARFEAENTGSVEAWTKEDSVTAQSQGWDLFEASVEGKIVSLIERCDEMDTFEDDDKALEFVKQQAAAGDQLATKALRLDHEGSAAASASA